MSMYLLNTFNKSKDNDHVITMMICIDFFF